MNTKVITDNFLIGESVFIVGHRKPDLDSIASAYAYQVYRHAKGDFNYLAIRCDTENSVTKWAFEHFDLDLPMLLKNVAGRKIVLVDHTDPEQRPLGWETAEIIEVLDHHKLKLETSVPPKITIRPYGATCTLIASKMLGAKITITKELAGLMLSAILDDTLALRSPVTTYVDRSVAGELSAIAGIVDLGSFAKKIFDKKDSWSKMGAERLVSSDTKDFDFDDIKIRVAQVETMDNRKIEKREKEILTAIRKISKAEGIDLYLVMLTDLLTNDCIMIAEGPKVEFLETVFDTHMENKNKIYLPGVLSRKKQVVPKLMEFFGKGS
ncbi:manganese-dependent inorganic pyrophosphatase [Candidatus Nomurabacteria bacterium]|uniref:inorganic diphosphatase n=1 Tax=Candidatus Dojkabacteria bacterium TaxID=2099670 RepID=A0A955KXV0_9BACT|nr:manganese-dependent inorganic pyrophosphatase [Candidatus Dojkabacteria bacterium]MCB9790066.1 manganese-dependent inorganic pyrophosphatase [Candidatus Nomurabacteria bacterium]